MEELMKALTRMANAIAAHYEKQGNPVLTIDNHGVVAAAPQEAPVVKTRKPRAPKAEAPAPAAPAAAEMTEEQSAKAVYDVAKRFMTRFQKPGAAGPDGKPATEGYHRLKALLADSYKVGKLADLVHAQRIQLMTTLQAEVAAADTAPADAGLGV